MAVKRWQRRRPGETAAQFHARLNRTCYACGHEAADVAACDEHEAHCKAAQTQGRKGRR